MASNLKAPVKVRTCSTSQNEIRVFPIGIPLSNYTCYLLKKHVILPIKTYRKNLQVSSKRCGKDKNIISPKTIKWIVNHIWKKLYN